MKYSERDALVQGLEELIEYLKTDKAMELPPLEVKVDGWFLSNAAKLRKYALALAPCTKSMEGDYAIDLLRYFGPVKVDVWCSKEEVCTRVQTGTKLVPETRVVKTGAMVEVPEYEWECFPSILGVKDA